LSDEEFSELKTFYIDVKGVENQVWNI